MGALGLGAADHATDPADTAVDDVVVQRAVGGSEPAAQHVIDGLVAESGDDRRLLVGNADLLRVAILVVRDRHAEDLFGRAQALLLHEVDVFRTRDAGLGARRDQLRMVATDETGQALHDALDIDDHRLHRAGGYRGLLHPHVASDADTGADQHLVRGAADAGEVDPPCSGLFCLLDNVVLPRSESNHHREVRFVPVDDDVYLILLEYAQVHLTGDRLRGTVEDVLDFRGDHGTAPTVGESRSARVLEQ